MPRTKQSQKQKQRQSVKQTVIVKVGETASKRKRVRRRRKPSGSGGAGIFQTPPLPNNVIYQSNQTTAVPYQFTPEAVPKITDAVKPPRTIMEDVGVGTEGFVKILDLPTKKETLSDLATPVSEKVPLRELNKQFLDNLDAKRDYFASMKEPIEPAKITDKINEPSIQLKGREGGVPTFNFADFQPVEKAIKQPKELPALDTGIYTPYDAEEKTVKPEMRQIFDKYSRFYEKKTETKAKKAAYQKAYRAKKKAEKELEK